MRSVNESTKTWPLESSTHEREDPMLSTIKGFQELISVGQFRRGVAGLAATVTDFSD